MAEIITISELHDRQRRLKNRADDHTPDLRVVMTMRQLCGVVAGATVLPSVPMLPQAQELFERFLTKAYGPSRVKKSRYEDAHAFSGRNDALVVEAVLGGTIYIADTNPDGHTTAAAMRRSMIGVPDTALLARQGRTGRSAVAFSSLEALAWTVRRSLQCNRPLISRWLEQGGIHKLWLHHRDGHALARMAGQGQTQVADVFSIYVSLTAHRNPRHARVHIGLVPESLAVAV